MVGTTLLNYRITEKLGAGGQGTVYKATDEKLGRTVVIKVLAPELMAREANYKRFEREAQLASSLDHPNICTIYGLHEANGFHFIAMQYIKGLNVRELVNGRPLALNRALSIATQVTDALTAAHARGIIHRDIKAGNVMVTDAGLAKVLDFGLAKLLDESAGEGRGDIHLTELGVPYGTATYAAPEQATGQRVDHRADIFSTGVLLYEMLAGTWPFRGQTSIEVRYAVLHDTPQPIAEARRDNPPPRLQQILDRALAKDPAARYQRMEEFRDELRAVVRELGTAGNANAVGDVQSELIPLPERSQSGSSGFGRTFRRWLRSLTGSEAQPTSIPPSNTAPTGTPTDPTSPNDPAAVTSSVASPSAATAGNEIHETPHTSQIGVAQKSIAILPFRNLNNDAQASFYEFSLADAVITELARLRSLVVRPSSLIVKYQGQQFDPVEAGRELKVSAVLSSSFLRVGERLRVNVQLLDVASGDLLWSDRIDATAEDIIALQDTIAQRIVDGLQLEHTSVEKIQSAGRSTRSVAAYEEYLRGRDFFGRYIFRTLDPQDCEGAIQHFLRAIGFDSSFALAHSGLGACYANRVIKGSGDAEDYERAESAFNEALALDPDVVEARMLMVFIYLARGEKQKAREEVARLQQKAPNEASVYFVKAALHRLDGEYERALRSFDRLAQLDPAARVVVSYNRARVLMYQNRFDEAIRELEVGSAIEPDHPLVKTFRAVALQRSGDAATAATILREVLARHPDMDGIRPLLAICLSQQGDHEAARAELNERVFESAAADHDIAYWLASAFALEGMREEAFEWLERAINLGNENRPWFESDPKWEALREDARFRELMNRIGTPSEAAGQQTGEVAHAAIESDAGLNLRHSSAPSESPDVSVPPVAKADASTHATASAAAYEEYLRGRDANGRFIYHTLAREDSDAAIEHFERAIELDPNFALAHCALGGAYANRVIKGFGGGEDYDRAEVAFNRSLALDPRLLEARLHMIFIYLARGEKQKAQAWVEILHDEAPNNVGVHFVYATLHRLNGEYDKALKSFSRMLRLNPAERVVVSYNRARIFMYQGRYDDALLELDLGARLEPNHPLIRTFRAVVLNRRGETEEAIRIIRDVLETHPGMDGIRPILAHFLSRVGEHEAARAELNERVFESAAADHDIAYWLASAFALEGMREEAFEWLERAINLGNENRPWFEADANWEALREDARFRELMNRIGTPPTPEQERGRAHTELP